MSITFWVGESSQQLSAGVAARLEAQLRLAAAGMRGNVDADAAHTVADAIDARLTHTTRDPILVRDAAQLDALFAVLNAVVHEHASAAMEMYRAVAAARSSNIGP
jgi:hypothetical protein